MVHPVPFVLLFMISTKNDLGAKGPGCSPLTSNFIEEGSIKRLSSRQALKSDHVDSNLASVTMRWMTLGKLLKSRGVSMSPSVKWR